MNIVTLPKAELHCHIDGLVHPDMLQAIQARGYQLPITPEDLQTAYPVQSFADFTQWFETAKPIAGHTKNFRPILAHHIEQLKAQLALVGYCN